MSLAFPRLPRSTWLVHRFAWIGLLLVVGGACGPGAATSSASSTTSSSSSSSSGASGASGSVSDSGTTDPEIPEPETLDASDFSRCSPGELADGCIEGDGHCMCGPRCSEYGPAGAPGRCPLGEFYAVCSEFYTCVVTCTEASECPDPAMVCLPCPEEIAPGCRELGSIGISEGYNGGEMMCTYATP